MLKIISQVCILAPSIPSEGWPHAVPDSPTETVQSKNCRALGLRSFATICLTRTLNRRRDRIFAARRRIFAALDQIIRAFAKFFRLTLRKIAALIRLLGKILARIFARLRRKQNAHQRAHSETHEEISDLGTYIVRHVQPPQKP